MTASIASRKVLVPLASLLAAGAIAVGSGATFTSTTDNTLSAVTSGTLTHSNSKDNAAIFTIPNMKPGDVVHGALKLTNTGTLPATFTLTETGSSNAFATGMLTLTVTDVTSGAVVYTGDFGGLADGVPQNLGDLAAGAAMDLDFEVGLDAGADNTQQGLSAGATYQWVSTQLDGETSAQ